MSVRVRAFEITVPLALTSFMPLVLGACSLSRDGDAGPGAAEGGAGSTLDAAVLPPHAGRDAASDASAGTTYQALVLSDSPLLYFRLGDSAQANSAAELVTGLRTTDTGKLAGNVPSTLEAWARPTNVTGTTGHVILRFEHGGNDGCSISYHGDDFPRLEREYAANVDTPFSGLETPLGVYSHVVGTYDGAVQRSYVNGEVAVASAADAGILGRLPAPFAIGGTDYATTNLFIGDIDEVAIYDHVLTDAAIVRHYQVGTGKTP